jgi:hypothetical protein
MTVLLRPNSTIDDVCALVGFSATVRLITWYGGSNLYVPTAPGEDHLLKALLGENSLARLIEEFGGTTVWVPSSLSGQHTAADALKRQVRDLMLKGHGSRVIAEIVGTSQRQVQRIARDLEEAGLLPVILCTPRETSGKNPQEKRP